VQNLDVGEELSRRALVRAAPPYLLLEGAVVALDIRKSTRARRMRLKIHNTGTVELVLPQAMSLCCGLDFVEKELGWIAQKLEKIEQPIAFSHGLQVPVLGKVYEICHQPQARRGVWLTDGYLNVSGDVSHLPRRIRDWYRREAKRELADRSYAYGALIGVQVGRITVRDQKSRWGSCSSQGNLNFSWRLMLMPEFVLDYVVAHEVSHLRHMNHGPEFWQLLGQIYPEIDTAKSWLQKNSAKIHKYDATNSRKV